MKNSIESHNTKLASTRVSRRSGHVYDIQVVVTNAQQQCENEIKSPTRPLLSPIIKYMRRSGRRLSARSARQQHKTISKDHDNNDTAMLIISSSSGCNKAC